MLPINEVYFGNCLDWMKLIDSNSIDMILCDLPYGIKSRNKWDVIIPIELLWVDYERIIKDGGIIVLTSKEPFTSYLVMSNLKLFRYDLIWQKNLPTGYLDANRKPLRNHENILIFYKKLPTYNPQKTKGRPYTMTKKSEGKTQENTTKIMHYRTENKGERFPKSIIYCSKEKGKEMHLHPTQKPVELFKYLIKTYTNKNNLVLDNCIGSGTTAIACLEINRNYIGIELDENYYNIALNRISQWKKDHNANN